RERVELDVEDLVERVDLRVRVLEVADERAQPSLRAGELRHDLLEVERDALDVESLRRLQPAVELVDAVPGGGEVLHRPVVHVEGKAHEPPAEGLDLGDCRVGGGQRRRIGCLRLNGRKRSSHGTARRYALSNGRGRSTPAGGEHATAEPPELVAANAR